MFFQIKDLSESPEGTTPKLAHCDLRELWEIVYGIIPEPFRATQIKRFENLIA